MKHLLYGIITVMFFAGLNGCKKSSVGKDIPVSITGKWYFTAYYYGIGGPGGWRPVTTDNQYIELKTDGGFSSNFSPFNAAATYQLTDSAHIKFIPQTGQNSLLYFFKLDSINNELQLSPANPICIDGCGQKFSR